MGEVPRWGSGLQIEGETIAVSGVDDVEFLSLHPSSLAVDHVVALEFAVMDCKFRLGDAEKPTILALFALPDPAFVAGRVDVVVARFQLAVDDGHARLDGDVPPPLGGPAEIRVPVADRQARPLVGAIAHGEVRAAGRRRDPADDRSGDDFSRKSPDHGNNSRSARVGPENIIVQTRLKSLCEKRMTRAETCRIGRPTPNGPT